MVAALSATRPDGPFDPECGVPIEAYAWRACVLHLRAYCWRQSSPVSETDHHLPDLRGVYRAELTEALPDAAPALDELLSEKVWHDTVRGQIDYLLAQQGDVEQRVAARILLDELPARAVAVEFALPITRVYRIARRARMLLSGNAMLFDLHRESP